VLPARSSVAAARSSNRVEKPAVVYLLAASHSGSTLLALLLAGHPDICTTGELKATSFGDPNRYRCSCGMPIRQCSFWADVTRAMTARGCKFDITRATTHLDVDATPFERRLLRPLVRGRAAEALRDAALACSPSWRRHLARFHQANAALVTALSERTGTRMVVDSSKVGIRLKYLLRNPGLDVKVVRLVRDGRAVALTYTNSDEYADASAAHLRRGGSGDGRPRDHLTLGEAAHEWRRSNEEAEALLATLDPSRHRTVTYEELCANTQPVLQSLWTFLGVEPAMLDRGWRARSRHVIGNGMRFDSTEDIRLDERWKTALDSTALARFDAEAGDLNRRLGYV
jgi:sulfotransferase family protein